MQSTVIETLAPLATRAPGRSVPALQAAFATVPVLIMAAYLLIARRLGAFEAL